MTNDELKEAILNIFTEVYEVKYIGTLKIERIKPVGLIVRLGMNNTNKPLYISAELDDVAFLKFFKQELYDRNLDLVEYSKVVITYPDNCYQQIDTRCGCHE